jgi:hypothetical protein
VNQAPAANGQLVKDAVADNVFGLGEVAEPEAK